MRHLVFVLLMLSLPAQASPTPITPGSIKPGAVGGELYANIYRLGTATVEYVSKNFGGGKVFKHGTEEEQCLRQEAMVWHLDQLRKYMKGAIYSDEAVAAILRLLLGPGGSGDDRCTPDNAGFKAWKAFEKSVDGRKKEALSEAIQDKLRDLGRPPRESDVAAILGGALLSSGITRATTAGAGFIMVDPGVVENPVKRWTSEDGT
jgi:hypothetical protein